MSPYLYPIIVAVSVITTFLTPYLIKVADPFTSFLAKKIPTTILQTFNTYTIWLQNIRTKDETNVVKQAIHEGLLRIFINLILIIGIFITGSYLSHTMKVDFFQHPDIYKAIFWGSSLIISLPLLIAIYRKLKTLSMLIAEIKVKRKKSTEYNIKLRRILAEIIPVAGMIGIIFMIIALSASILPPAGLFIVVLIVVALLAAILWSWLIKLHLRLHTAFMYTFKKKK